MNQIYHKVRAIAYSALLFASTVASADNINVSPFLNFRSPGTNVVSKISDINAHKFLADMDGFYGFLNLNFNYERSFRPGGIAGSLFGQFLVDDRTINITGSAVANRAATDWLADYFFLPTDFNGSIQFTPRVQNYVLFLEAYFGFDEWVRGLYLDIYGSVVNSRYNLEAEEAVTTAGVTGYQPGYFAPTAIAASALNQTALSYLSGEPLSITGLTIQQLNYAKIKNNESDKQTAFSELRAELGYNFFLEEDYHWGLNLQLGFPTGDKPKAHYLFEAMPSSGKYFKLGGGMTGHYTFWRSDDGDHHFDIWMDLAVTHWFKGKQHRTFDLQGLPLSRYMLAEQMVMIAPTGALLAGADADAAVAPTPAVQFSGTYAPVANISTREVKVSVGAEVDLAVWFVYMCKGFEFDLGYNFWYRSSERIHLSGDQAAIPANTWALKGDAFVYGAPSANFANAVGLSATDSSATINSGRSLIDTPAAAFTTVEGVITQLSVTTTQFSNTSTNPVFITDEILDIDGAKTRGLSNKVFGNFSYTWVNNENWIPVLGIGFEGEFGRSHGRHNEENSTKSTTTTNESGSRNVALSKWAVSVKLGVSFE